MSRLFTPVLLAGAHTASAVVLASSTAVTPIAKVITLLKDLEVKIAEEGTVDAKQYDDYACFCKEQSDEKLYNIEKSDKVIAKLAAEIEKLGAEISELNGDIKALKATIKNMEDLIKQERAARKVEREAYVAEDRDLTSAIDSMVGAIKALRESKQQIAEDPDAKVDFVQVKALVGRAFSKLGQTPPDYQYSSNDILATLESLKDQFVQNKADAGKAEIDNRAADEKKISGLDRERQFAEKDLKETEEVLGERTEEMETAVGKKSDETTDRAANQGFLNKLTNDCQEKAKLWDQRSKSRAAELQAIDEAKVALEKGAAPNWKANKKLADLQTKASPSFLQLRESSQEVEATAARRVVDKLAKAGTALNSEFLALAAAKARMVAMPEDHFVKVRSLIKDLIKKLRKDAAAEAEQKSFCDKAIFKAVSQRDAQQAKVEEKSAKQARGLAELKQLAKQIADLSESIAAEKKALLDATELRKKESTENNADIAAAHDGELAVQEAIQVLKKYYQPGLVQLSKTYMPEAPEVFDAEYHGTQAASKGIVGLLEVVLTDFARTKVFTTTGEFMAGEAFTGLKVKSEQSIKSQEGSRKTKEDRTVDVKAAVMDLYDDVEDAQAEKANAEKSLDELNEQCIKAEETYAERVEKRNREIEALKEGIDALDDMSN